MYGDELLYIRIWRDLRTLSLACDSPRNNLYMYCVRDSSLCRKGNSRLTKLLGGLRYEKIWWYNNSPPYVTARWPPQQIPPLNFLDFSSTCITIRAIQFEIHTPPVVDLQSTFHIGSINFKRISPLEISHEICSHSVVI